MAFEVLRRVPHLLRAVLAERRARAFEHWSLDQQQALQQQRLNSLVAFASRHSPWWRQRLGGVVDQVRLEHLPPTGKSELLANLDQAATDRRITREAVESQLAARGVDPLLAGEFRVLVSSGSSGVRGLYVYARRDWVQATAQLLRFTRFIGLRPRLSGRTRAAAVGAVDPRHFSYRISTAVDVGLTHTLRLGAHAPLADLVAALNAHQPQYLQIYPSLGALLAAEQQAGRLHISPQVISTSSELLTPDARARMQQAFGIAPFNMYGTSEAGIGACECAAHDGLHVFADAQIIENLDAQGRPVAPGCPGAKIYLTSLLNYSLPMIRMELNDQLTIDERPCSCGRTLPRITQIDGRSDEVFEFQLAHATVVLHPIALRRVIGACAGVLEHQLEQQGERLTLRLVAEAGADVRALCQTLGARLRQTLDQAGLAGVNLIVEPAAALVRESSGKLKLVRKL